MRWGCGYFPWRVWLGLQACWPLELFVVVRFSPITGRVKCSVLWARAVMIWVRDTTTRYNSDYWSASLGFVVLVSCSYLSHILHHNNHLCGYHLSLSLSSQRFLQKLSEECRHHHTQHHANHLTLINDNNLFRLNYFFIYDSPPPPYFHHLRYSWLGEGRPDSFCHF